jgi:acetolactate decarboxylase
MNHITIKESLSQIALIEPVQVIGNLRAIASNNLNNQVKFSSLTKKPHLYGLGMPSGLNAEILVLDGKAYYGKFSSLAYEVQQLDNFDISFMVYAYVPSWKKIEIPETVQTFADLEIYIPQAAATQGMETVRLFPFRLEGEVSALDWFVVNGMGNGVPNHLGSFLRSRYLGGLGDRQIEALGFYSQSHRGVLTNPNSNMHIHFKTTDEKIFVGHINDSVIIKPGFWLLLPNSDLNYATPKD